MSEEIEIVDAYRGQGGRYEIIDGVRVQVEPPTQEPQPIEQPGE